MNDTEGGMAMKKIIRNTREYSELTEIFDVMNHCHHFRYSEALQARALSHCENPDMINQVIHRIGKRFKIPTALMRQMLFEVAGEFYEPIMLGDLLMEYWLRYLIKIKDLNEVVSLDEYLIVREFFIYFLKLEQINDKYCSFEFRSPIEEDDVLLCT